MRGVIVGTGKRLTEVVHRIATLLTSGLHKSRELQESKARLEEAQRVAHVGYRVWDLDSDRVTWSDETYRIYGLMPQKGPIDLATIREMVHPEDRETGFRIAEEAILGRVRPDAEHRIVRPSGEVRTVNSQGDLKRDTSGRPYQMFGTVRAEVGPDVAQLRVGDHVVGSLAQSCGACPRCLSGRSFQCTHPELTLRRPSDAPRLSRNGTGLFQGFGLGGFAERALIHENQLAVVPKQLPFAQAALLGCGVVTGAGSVLNTANVSAGDTVVVFGAGGVGLNAVSGARIAGASRIVVIDLQAKRLDEALRFGATDVIDSTKQSPSGPSVIFCRKEQITSSTS